VESRPWLLRRWCEGRSNVSAGRDRLQTIMTNPYLLQEILDDIIDLLHDEPETLKRCCLVSKSWAPRARKHLFARIEFQSPSELESWKKTFPDVGNSPGYHARTLFVGCVQLVTPSDGEEGGWIRAFSGVKSLGLDGGDQYNRGLRASEISLVPFRELALTLKSLRMGRIYLPYAGLFDFIISFPLLEDLSLTGVDDPHFDGYRSLDGLAQTVIPSTSPPLTGSLDFHVLGGAGDIARQLLDLPNGLRFRKLALLRDHEMDVWWITELVARCSHTLESLDVGYTFRGTFIYIWPHRQLKLFPVGLDPGSFDLSKAVNLHHLVFRPELQSVKWITMALQTITPEHRDLRQISIHMPQFLTLLGTGVGRFLGDAACREWSDLDCFLVQFWESRSIRLRAGCVSMGQRLEGTEDCIGCLLPEMMKRGIADPL